MVDELTQSEGAGAVGADGATMVNPSPTPDTGSKRLLLIVAAVVALLVVAGLVAAAVFVFVLGGATETDTTVPVAVDAPTPQPTEAVPDEPEPVSLKRVFTFRDIFDPLLLPLPAETPQSSGLTTDGAAPPGGAPGDPASPGGDPGVTLPENTLFLRDIVSVDGVAAAVLHLNGQDYTLVVGGQIPGTPWQVLSISGNSVVMLYGDVQVTLSVGQGVVSAAK